MPVELTELTTYGHHMSADEFLQFVKDGMFIPYDGDGFWSTDIGESRLGVWDTPRPDWATHVMWYNK